MSSVKGTESSSAIDVKMRHHDVPNIPCRIAESNDMINRRLVWSSEGPGQTSEHPNPIGWLTVVLGPNVGVDKNQSIVDSMSKQQVAMSMVRKKGLMVAQFRTCAFIDVLGFGAG